MCCFTTGGALWCTTADSMERERRQSMRPDPLISLNGWSSRIAEWYIPEEGRFDGLFKLDTGHFIRLARRRTAVLVRRRWPATQGL